MNEQDDSLESAMARMEECIDSLKENPIYADTENRQDLIDILEDALYLSEMLKQELMKD